MLKKIIIVSVLFFASCAKDKITEVENTTPFLTADCPDTIKFSTQVMPIISQWCAGCHGEGGPYLPTLKDYLTVSEKASNILKSIKADGLPLMPKGGPALADSLIQVFSCWIQQGKLNN